jgi:hypothetical protein
VQDGVGLVRVDSDDQQPDRVGAEVHKGHGMRGCRIPGPVLRGCFPLSRLRAS